LKRDNTISTGLEKPLRPFSVTLLTIGVLILAGVNLIRLVQSLRLWEFLNSLRPQLPLYLAITGLVWGLVGLLVAWGMWTGQHWAPVITRLAALAYTLYFWFDRLFIRQQVALNANWPFAAVATLVVLIFVFWTLSRRKAKNYFGETHDR
jgi:hypothetical protein